MFQQYQNRQVQQPEQAKPGLKDRLRRLKDQYPFKDAASSSFLKLDEELPTGETPELSENETIPSEPSGTKRAYQPQKQSYTDVKFGLSRRGR